MIYFILIFIYFFKQRLKDYIIYEKILKEIFLKIPQKLTLYLKL